MAEVRKRSGEGVGFAKKNDFKLFVLHYARQTMKRRNVANWNVIEPSLSESLLFDLLKEFVPEKMQKADKQNRARFIARTDAAVTLCSGIVNFQ